MHVTNLRLEALHDEAEHRERVDAPVLVGVRVEAEQAARSSGQELYALEQDANWHDVLSTQVARTRVGSAKERGLSLLQLRNGAGKVVAAQRFELRELLVSAETPVKARLPGRIDAASIAISLTRDEPKK